MKVKYPVALIVGIAFMLLSGIIGILINYIDHVEQAPTMGVMVLCTGAILASLSFEAVDK